MNFKDISKNIIFNSDYNIKEDGSTEFFLYGTIYLDLLDKENKTIETVCFTQYKGVKLFPEIREIRLIKYDNDILKNYKDDCNDLIDKTEELLKKLLKDKKVKDKEFEKLSFHKIEKNGN
jgi:hypothetical protein